MRVFASRPWHLVLWLTFISFVAHAVELSNVTSPTYQFKSRPDLHAPILDLTIHRPELISPGYIFLAPYRNVAPGPYIYDNYGELVWSGAGAGGPRTAHMPHVCQYKGQDHLCYFQGDQHHGYARGFGVIMDNAYRVVKTIESSCGSSSADMHEFRLTPYSDGKTVLMSIYEPRPYDLMVNARYNMQNGLGWVIDGTFQEVDVETGELVFEWRSLDHIDPSRSLVMPGSTDTSGTGLDTFTAWDYFHLNSIDKNKDGDYLISARHASAIYKISGIDGHIIWQLGGVASDFELLDFKFGYQHEARWITENATHTVLSFFDNSSNAYNHTSVFSRGVIVAINHIRNTASIVKFWSAPEPAGGLRSGSQGNMQLLANGGSIICWGEHAYFSEHTADGSAVMYGKLAKRSSNVMIYRTYKFDWTAQPLTKPSIWTYSKSGDSASGMRVYISWNGATEVRSWRVYTASATSGPFEIAGTSIKQGFETEIHLPGYADWTYAEALDGQGRILASSGFQRTFVPGLALAAFCDERGDCQYNVAVNENDTVLYNAHIETEEQYLSTNRGYDPRKYYIDTSSTAGSVYHAIRHQSGSTVLWLVVLITASSAAILLLRRRRFSAALQSLPGAIRSVMTPRKMKLSPRTQEKDELEMLSPGSSAIS